jgi:hypothetical protein
MQDQNRLPRIFISYRREDSAPWAGRIADWLSSRFGALNVFFDVHAITPGSDFIRTLHERASKSDVLLAIIGEDWLTVRGDDGQPRLRNQGDFVRTEIALALSQRKRVIPLLVSGARMPQPRELPEDLADLARREAVEISDTSFRSTMDSLIPIMLREVQRRPKPVPEQVPAALDVVRAANEFTALIEKHWMVSAWCLALAILAFSPLWFRWLSPYHAIVQANTTSASRPPATLDVGLPPKPEPPATAPKADFRTLYVINHGSLFTQDGLNDGLKENREFASLNIEIVDDAASADAFLEVASAWPGDFTYSVRLRATGAVLITKEGSLAVTGAAATATLAQDVIQSITALEAKHPAAAN